MCKILQSSAFSGQKIVHSAVHNAFLNTNNGNVAPMRSGSFSTLGTAFHVFPLEMTSAVEALKVKFYGMSARIRLMEMWIPNMKFDCRFVFSRLPLRLQHRAVELAFENSLSNFLFPTPETVCTRSTSVIPLEQLQDIRFAELYRVGAREPNGQVGQLSSN